MKKKILIPLMLILGLTVVVGCQPEQSSESTPAPSSPVVSESTQLLLSQLQVQSKYLVHQVQFLQKL